MRFLRALPALALLATVPQTPPPADATARIVGAAQELMKVLDEAGKKKVQFPLEGPQTTRWSNLPSPMFQRDGLKLGDLTAPQKAAAMNLLTVALSRDGYRKVTEIMKGDEVLRTGAGGRGGKAFALVNALDAAQRGQAVLPHVVADLVLGPGQDGKVIQPEGLRASAMTPAQQAMLLELVREWAGIVTDGFAEPRMAEIKANLPQTYFAWSGPTTAGSVAYFRIQGPTVVIEYAPQKTVDRIHTIYRDPTNDYGAKFVAR
jgi:hypothetical protein